MSDNQVKLSSFPSCKEEALTMLYLDKLDLSNLSPEDLAKKYIEVEKEIKEALKNHKRKELKIRI